MARSEERGVLCVRIVKWEMKWASLEQANEREREREREREEECKQEKENYFLRIR